MSSLIHTIRSVDRLTGTAENFNIELVRELRDINLISLLSATITNNAGVDNYYIRIKQINNNNVLSHNGITGNTANFIIPHHHVIVGHNQTEYMVNAGFSQIINIYPNVSCKSLDIQLMDDTGALISGAGEWHFTVRIDTV